MVLFIISELYYLCNVLSDRCTLDQHLPAALLRNTMRVLKTPVRMCPPPNCNHKQLSRLLKSAPHNTVSRNGYHSFLNSALYRLDSLSPMIYRVWFLIMSNLQSNYQISRSNYVEFSGIVKKHQSMTCLTFSLFYFAMIEAMQPQVPYFQMLYLA